MRNTISYEWDFETTDEDGEILDHHHEDKLDDLAEHFIGGDHGDLVLTRNEGNEIDGVTDILWAYVKDGKLPECFSNAMNYPLPAYKVPQKFHKELEAFNKRLNK